MNQSKKAENIFGHQMLGKDEPRMDDEGDMVCYAKCVKCGTVENTKEAATQCTPNPPINI